MSAHIKNLDKIILSEAKKLLLEQGIRGITTRNLAKECGISGGTVYNYYESKERLAFAVILTDWAEAVQKAENRIRRARSGADGMLAICKSTKSFFKSYQKILESEDTKQYFREAFYRHLIDEIVELEEAVFRRFPCVLEPVPYDFLAKSILQAGIHKSVDDDEFLRMMQRFFNN